jgi:hypothetical protein
MCAKEFDNEQKVMKMYTENASLYIKLSSAGLLLTVTFSTQIMGMKPPLRDVWLEWMWGGFLVAIAAGAFYQYLAVKYPENLLPARPGFTSLNWLVARPEQFTG